VDAGLQTATKAKPSWLEVFPSAQTYTVAGYRLVRYSSGSFTADLELDDRGYVTHYPASRRSPSHPDHTARPESMGRPRIAAWIAAFAGIVQMGLGAWAFFAPRSFYDTIATFPPYNEHFLHDIGAFQLGIGAALLAALVWRDVLFVALAGGAVGAVFHWVSHLRDRDLGGSDKDPWTLGAFALLLLVGVAVRWRSRAGAR
jgi:hypothetical protein